MQIKINNARLCLEDVFSSIYVLRDLSGNKIFNITKYLDIWFSDLSKIHTLDIYLKAGYKKKHTLICSGLVLKKKNMFGMFEYYVGNRRIDDYMHENTGKLVCFYIDVEDKTKNNNEDTES